MNHAPIFDEFVRANVEANGFSIYDFRGVATDVRFKSAWSKFAPGRGAKLSPPLPPVNEHYYDWILTLQSVVRASGTYRMIELGAGWGTWASAAAKAAEQRPSIDKVELVAIEADETHFDWMKRHFITNGLKSQTTHLVHGAVAPDAGVVRFPVIDKPNEDYGASMKQVYSGKAYVEVTAYTLSSLLDKLTGPADFLHVDIQGAEYDVIPPVMDLLRKQVKSIMIGTHTSLEKHNEMSALFRGHNWRETMNFPRGALCDTPYGQIQFGDGLVAVENPDFI